MSALPDKLHAALFDTDLGCCVPIDGARVGGIAALLDPTGAQGQCLFRGDRLAECAAAGPWLAGREPDSRLAGQLFTASKAPQHLWGKVNFVLLHSRAGAPALIAHFRRYIRLRRADGSSPLFRFWDGQVLFDYFDGCASMPQHAARFFGAQGDAPLVEAFLLATQDATGLERFTRDGPLPPEAQTPDPGLTAQDEAILRKTADRQIVRKVEARLAKRCAQVDPAQAHHANTYARGAKMRNPLVPMSQRIAMLRESYFAALQQAPLQGER